MIDELGKKYDERAELILKSLQELLSIQSISADTQYGNECLKAYQWLEERLQALGFRVERIADNVGKPILFAERLGVESVPSVLFYGHYDVQPVDPVDQWTTPPFEPQIREGRIYARGAQDNKGQLWYVLSAIECLIQTGHKLGTIKILLEGEEEIGSPTLARILEQERAQFTADILLVCDTGTLDPAMATITMGLRGIASCEVMVAGPKYDLHSGVHGGVVRNPALSLARMLATLHNDSGQIAVKGFYDDLQEPSELDRQLANSVPYNIEQYQAQVGVAATGGETSYSLAERRGFRPTIEVNGLHGGYGGEGGKTIIPSQASVKLSTRLGMGQDPSRCIDLVIAHLQSVLPEDLRLTVVSRDVGGPALSLSSATPLVQRARVILQKITGHEALCMWEGASIPIVSALARAARAEPLLVGFGLEEDCIHAPNESFSLSQFKKGFLFAAAFLMGLADGSSTK
jgi:acetylornithine deacetylase/succinyl-diaminopimelate desuccinylase-like protein